MFSFLFSPSYAKDLLSVSLSLPSSDVSQPIQLHASYSSSSYLYTSFSSNAVQRNAIQFDQFSPLRIMHDITWHGIPWHFRLNSFTPAYLIFSGLIFPILFSFTTTASSSELSSPLSLLRLLSTPSNCHFLPTPGPFQTRRTVTSSFSIALYTVIERNQWVSYH